MLKFNPFTKKLDYWNPEALDYKGTFDASGGSYPSGPAQGDYYIVNIAGTVNGVTYAVGDWIVYNGSTWDKIDNQSRDTICLHIDNPTNADTRIVYEFPRTAVIIVVRVLALGGGTLTCILNQANANGAGTPVQIMNSITATTTKQTAVITAGNITAGNTLQYVSTGKTGTVNELLFFIDFTM